MSDEKAEANINLIAASPELLDVLKSVLEWYEWEDSCVGFPAEQVRKVIRKAEGE